MKTKKTDKRLLLKQENEIQLDKVSMRGVRGGEDPPPPPPDPTDPQNPPDDTDRLRRIAID